jgi:predicted kinase
MEPLIHPSKSAGSKMHSHTPEKVLAARIESIMESMVEGINQERIYEKEKFHFHEDNTKEILIMRGVPGSGKSYYINAGVSGVPVVCSADNFFIHPETKKYNWNRSHIGMAHAMCKQLFKYAVYHKCETIIIDNTNIKIEDYEYYTADGYNTTLVNVHGVLSDKQLEGYAKNNKHDVPLEVIIRMYKEFFERS